MQGVSRSPQSIFQHPDLGWSPVCWLSPQRVSIRENPQSLEVSAILFFEIGLAPAWPGNDFTSANSNYVVRRPGRDGWKGKTIVCGLSRALIQALSSLNLSTILNSHQIGHSRKQDNYCVTNTFQFFPIHLHKFDRQYGQVNLQLMMKWYRDVRWGVFPGAVRIPLCLSQQQNRCWWKRWEGKKKWYTYRLGRKRWFGECETQEFFMNEN